MYLFSLKQMKIRVSCFKFFVFKYFGVANAAVIVL